MGPQTWELTGWSATEWARQIAGRGDVTVTIEVTPGGVNTDPTAGRIRIDPHAAELTVDDSGRVPTTRTLVDRLSHPILAGLVLDGASRAAHSRWLGRTDCNVPAGVLETAWALDAARAHRRLIIRSPRSRLFLRSAAPVTMTGVRSPRSLLEQVLPQVDAGVLPRWMGDRIRPDVENEFGADIVRACAQIWRQVLALRDSDDKQLLALAEQWCQLLPDAEPDSGSGAGGSGSGEDPASPAVAVDGDGHDGENGADPGDLEGKDTSDAGDHLDPRTGTGIGTGSGWTDLLRDLAAETSAEAELELHQALGPQPTPEKRADATQRDLAAAAARSVFDAKSLTRVRNRPPTEAEIAERAAIVRRLKRAQYEAPRQVTEHVAYPAGKARTSGLVQRAAQRANGQVVTATPWRRNRRKVAEKPPLHVGVVVDVSGSMGRWLPSAGSVIWSIAAAAAALGGTTAATGFGGAVTALLGPRTHPNRVPIVPGGSSSTGCTEAMSAVTAGAELTTAFGARVLVVLTDGELPSHEATAIDARVRYLRRHDVCVVWALTGDRRQASVIPADTTVVDHVTPNEFAGLVSGAIATALEQAHAGGDAR
ncbi:hypothetical protein SIM91_05835 [Rhodococcus opacus]|uniref:hypothetical protein n=1 Tax=Rhodococcus opacus TaxID=37919 RepID=UPI0002A40759|nr:hypothetical protein [Rhodococcus opacus]ELB87622.1 hypothetical protein Rwratislav_38993 [Rhodococcus wratislaviensis IFP 2016]MDX5962835.1 hypothetical protein [Rhodococcus opacus]CAG7637393.1 hypothetical protein E143388_07890 [Rhodococcus opacus]